MKTLPPDVERYGERAFAPAERAQALRAQVEHLGIDYRDVILEGEYVHRDGDWVRVRDLSEPLGDDS